MAVLEVTVAKLGSFNKALAETSQMQAITSATDGATVVMDGRDESLLLRIENTAATSGTAIIKHGNGVQGCNDLSIVVAASSAACVCLESGRFKNVSGTHKGKVHITGPTSLKLGAWLLP